jgi:CRP/FNR family transcriptional regulator, cyclic AMP receptor protein
MATSEKIGIDKPAVLRQVSLFEGLSAGALSAVAERTVTRQLPREAVLFREGQPCPGLYIVAAGRVVVYQASPDGREHVLESVRPGQSLAELPIFDGGPYPASARAAEDSVLLFLPLADFQGLYRSNPEIADVVIGHLGKRMRKLVRHVERLSLKDVPARLAATILDYARAAGALDGDVAFRVPRTHYDLAAELATSRETVSRSFARLRRDGIIRQDGAEIRVLSLDRLRRAAGLRERPVQPLT